MKTSIEKVTDFWLDNGEQITGNPAMAAAMFPALQQRLRELTPDQLDSQLTAFAGLMLSLRSDGAREVTLVAEHDDPAAAPTG